MLAPQSPEIFLQNLIHIKRDFSVPSSLA